MENSKVNIQNHKNKVFINQKSLLPISLSLETKKIKNNIVGMPLNLDSWQLTSMQQAKIISIIQLFF